MLKYGRSDLVRSAGLLDAIDDDDAEAELLGDDADLPEEFANDLEALGPTYVKLGQLLSTRADLLPRPYLDALCRLQDDVDPIPPSDIEAVVESQLGSSVDHLFARFDPVPIAAASIGQVHHAMTHRGQLVAVKVQRPGIRSTIMDDLDVLEEMAGFIDARTELGRTHGFSELLDQFRTSLLAELDYRLEASNLEAMADHLERFPRLVVPQPVQELCSSKVLTMELIDGEKITELSPERLVTIEAPKLADELFTAYLEQILVVGFVHADPHPGNLLVTRNGEIALLDLGMVARIDQRLQQQLVKLMLAISEGNGHAVAELVESIGSRRDAYDPDRLRTGVVSLVGRHNEQTVSEVGAGTILMELMQICGDAHLRLPAELSMVGKALLNLDEVTRVLDPQFDAQEAMRAYGGQVLTEQLKGGVDQASLIRTALETKELVESLPRRADKLLGQLTSGSFTVKVDAVDKDDVILGIEHIANRVTTGVLLAAIIIGAAMTMRVETDTEILGYPAISIIFFVAAAVGGFALMLTILFGDQRRRKRSRS